MDDERKTCAPSPEEKEGYVSDVGRSPECEATPDHDGIGALNKSIASFYLSVLGQFWRILQWTALLVWRLLRGVANALYKSISGLFSLLTKASLWHLIGRILVLIALSLLPLAVFAAISHSLYHFIRDEWGRDAAHAFGWIWGFGWIVSVIMGIHTWLKTRQNRTMQKPSPETNAAAELGDKGAEV